MLNRLLSKNDCVSILETINMCYRSDAATVEEKYFKSVASLQKIIDFNYAISVLGRRSLSRTAPVPAPNVFTHTDIDNAVKSFEAYNFNYPVEYIKTYQGEALYRIDPVMIRNFSEFGYQRWEDTYREHPPDSRFASITSDFDLTKGCTYGYQMPGKAGGSLFSIAGRDMQYNKRTDAVLKHTVPHLNNLLMSAKPQDQYHLTQREQEVLKWLCNGKTSWDISAILNITERTVNFHISNLCAKLDAVNRPQLIAVAVANGLVSIEDIL
ncbi:MAG: LuxR C-terminal-related transcriptional regulator [Nitrospiraceae bacterium]|nr:LuxR C-terminal-related transcriptional regulator [Nitrospiraceae bacterium]